MQFKPHKMLFASVLMVSGVVVSAGCTDDVEQDRADREPSAIIRDQQASKADGYSRCSGCGSDLCGMACAAGKLCIPTCMAADGRATSFVRFAVTGAEAWTFDTRGVPFTPVFRFDNIIIWGTEVWEFRSDVGQPVLRNGFDIRFDDIDHAALTASQPFKKGASISVYIRDFQGPGTYRAEASFTRSETRPLAGGAVTASPRYAQPNVCSVVVSAAGSKKEDGLRGTFECPTVKSASGAAIGITGEFLSKGTAIGGIGMNAPLIVAKENL